MTKNEKQFKFTRMLGHLILYAESEGLDITIREVQRFPERQRQLVAYGKSKTYKSKHLDSLAADIILFRDGEPIWNARDDDYVKLGEKWEELGGTWGGRWDFSDGIHFEYEG